MAKKKLGPLQSQISGTIWFAVVLIAILALVFFFFPKSDNASQQDPKEQKNIADLQKKEDSVYHSRRQENASGRGGYERASRSSSHEGGIEEKNSRRRGSDRQVAPNPYYTTEPPAPTRQPRVVELNSADTTTLQLLHGIGPAYARRIVKHRERLGGFTSTDQLLEVYGFTPELLDHIRPYLRLDTQALQKINVNTMTLKQLIRHPYMEDYFARDLVNLRSRGATFRSPDDLRTIPSCSDSLLARLLPYLDFDTENEKEDSR